MTTADFCALPELCVRGLQVRTSEGVLQHLAQRAVAAGAVTDTFPAALLEREATHPTGLPTAIPVAIPHADAAHVRTAGMGIAVLETPVSFGVMGGAGAQIDVGIVLMLLVPEAHAQVTVLSRLMEIVQRPTWDASLRLAGNASELAAAFNLQLSGPTEQRARH
ncbi:MAG: PTS sugar transporter subunit IIA [Propioniciclava sp.]